MPVTLAYDIAGNTIGLSLANTSHAAVTIGTIDSSANALLVCNTGTTEVMYVTVASSSSSATAPSAGATSVPGDGTAGGIPVLAYSQTIISGCRFPVSVTGICSVAGPTLMTVTPITLM
jgi:hypothetical protein